MDKIIKIYDHIGSEGRSRSNVQKLGFDAIPEDCHVVLDFEGINFLSRSFTDEIITQMEGRSYQMVNLTDDVQKMFQAVINGRNKKRIHETSDKPILRFKSLVDLSKYLNNVAM